MINVPVKDLLIISEKVYEFKKELISRFPTDDDEMISKIISVCEEINTELMVIFQYHGSICFFTKKNYEVLLREELLEKITRIVGWM